MHNLALALQKNGYTITGSDDEIYNPSKDRLAKAGLLPSEMGWFPERITSDLDAVILGMHARSNNPEIHRAQEIGLPIYSYPEFLYHHSKNKKRVVVAGSHGKTTTTAMIMHVLTKANVDFDYMVGAQLDGYERMVRLSDAPLMVVEGDEYLSSPIDRRPKFLHYRPHITIITGIAWDHINVFPTFEGYVEQFAKLIGSVEWGGEVIYYNPDKQLQSLLSQSIPHIKCTPYRGFETELKDGQTFIKKLDGTLVPLKVFGQHNMENFKAAYHVCKSLGISDEQFFEAITSFTGASKRLQVLNQNGTSTIFLDYAHAPSKLKATIDAVKAQFSNRELVACFELHTFSSLNKAFLPHYKDSMEKADTAVVFFSEHTLKMKKLPSITSQDIVEQFNHVNLKVFTAQKDFVAFLKKQSFEDKNLLLMSSGTFNGLDYKGFAEELI